MIRAVSGVRELFEQEPPPPPRKTRAELMKDIDADYYGYRDDDDGILAPLEFLAEKKCTNIFLVLYASVKSFCCLFIATQKAVAEWKAKKDKGEQAEKDEEEEDIYAVNEVSNIVSCSTSRPGS